MEEIMLELKELRAEIARLAALVEKMQPHEAGRTLWCDWMEDAIGRAAVAEFEMRRTTGTAPGTSGSMTRRCACATSRHSWWNASNAG